MTTEHQTWDDILDQVSREKGIPKKVIVEALEQAILKAAAKVFGEERSLEATYNPEKGQVELFQYMEVVEEIENKDTEINLQQAVIVDSEAEVGDELGFQIFYLESDKERAKEEDEKYQDILNIRTSRKIFGRIAAQTVKKEILKKVQEAERNMVYADYKDREGDLVTGTVRRFERGSVIVDLGRAEGLLPAREQCPRESYRPGDRVQAYLKEVVKDTRGHQLILSRTDPRFVEELFEKEVPEIYEGIVTIMNVARDPGERTKIAVVSKDSDVDPVGACVGLKGARVQAIVQELKGEKIDIVPYSPDLARYVCNAIAPAEVVRVLIDEDSKQIELIVPDDQQSLAIGRRGQNVKLASKLVQWKIEVHSLGQVDAWKEQLAEILHEIEGIEEASIQYIFKLGYNTPQNLAQLDDVELMAIPGVTPEIAAAIKDKVMQIVEQGGAPKKAEPAKPVEPAKPAEPAEPAKPAEPADNSVEEPVEDVELENEDESSSESEIESE